MKRAFLTIVALALVTAAPAAASRVTPSERRAIDRTIDGFVNSGMKRQNVDAAWNLVTPDIRTGVTRSAWDKGNLPVAPYPAGGTTFHDWTVDSASPNEVDFELMIPSARSKHDSIQYSGTVKKIGGRWLIDSFNPGATFSGPGTVVGANDFTAQANTPGTGTARLGSTWIAIPVAIIAGSLLLVLGGFLFVWARNRRAYRRAHHRPLEPIVVRRRDSEPALVAKERGEADG